jgi:hypothetical protein
VLGVSHLLVLGHESCGGVQSLLEGAPNNARDFVSRWMSMADAARLRATRCASLAERQRCAEREIAKLSLGNLGGFPWIAEGVRGSKLVLHGAWFSVRTGALSLVQALGRLRRRQSKRHDDRSLSETSWARRCFCSATLMATVASCYSQLPQDDSRHKLTDSATRAVQ